MLAQYASWRWIFVVDVPLGIAGIVLARRLVPDLRPGAPRLDRLGFALTALGVGRSWSRWRTSGRPRWTCRWWSGAS